MNQPRKRATHAAVGVRWGHPDMPLSGHADERAVGHAKRQDVRVDIVGAVLALLPLVVVGLVLVLLWRWQQKRGQVPFPVRTKPMSRARASTLLIVVLLVATALSGWMGGWSLESLLMPVGWLATGFALLLLDRFLDRRIKGPGRKVVFVVGFWWVFVWSAALGAVVAFFGIWGEQSRAQVMVTGIVMVLLVAASIWAVRARFGYSKRA